MTDTTTPEQMSAEDLAAFTTEVCFIATSGLDNPSQKWQKVRAMIEARDKATAARVRAEPSGAQWISVDHKQPPVSEKMIAEIGLKNGGEAHFVCYLGHASDDLLDWEYSEPIGYSEDDITRYIILPPPAPEEG